MPRLALLAMTTLLALLALSCYRQVTLIEDIGVPTSMAFAPDGRLFITEKRGGILIAEPPYEKLLETPFVGIPVSNSNERGLVGIAFDPDFATSPYVYAHYVTPEGIARISRFRADTDIAGPEEIIFTIGPVHVIHVGGAIHFGPDGKLYIGSGDGGRRSRAYAQSTVSLQGKILRINKDGTIPEDNPWGNAVWSIGLRNPFTFAFGPEGQLYVNDVGEVTTEEINHVQRGKNYGWPVCEGPCDRPFEQPVYSYGRGDGRAITGAVFYGDAYLFADYIAGWIKSLRPDGSVVTLIPVADRPVDLDIGPDGKIYYLSLSGKVYRLEPSGAGVLAFR